MAPKRYLNGVTDVSGTDPMSPLGVLDPSKYTVYHEDFSLFSVGVAAGTTSGYQGMYSFSPAADATISVVADAGATGCCLKQAIVNQDTTYSRLQGGVGSMVLESGKKAFMETRIEVTAATIASHFWAVGMCTPAVAGDAAGIHNKTSLIADDSWVFFKDLASSTIYGRSGENDVNVDATLLATQVTAVWYKLSCYYDGTDMFWYVNDSEVAKSTPTIPVTPVSPIFMVQTSKAEACVLLVDYLTIIMEK